MSTSARTPGPTSTPPAGTPGAPHGPTSPPRTAVVLGAAAVLVGLLVYLIGLPRLLGQPGDTDVAGTALSSLSLPLALAIALGGVWIAGSLAAPRAGWRVVDIVVASVLGVAGGLLFVVWNLNYGAISAPLSTVPAIALLGGVWLLPAVLGGLVIRKPGAAVYTELVAAVLSALVGNQWGFSTVWYGLIEGLGAEVVFAVLLYRRFGLPTAMVAGAVDGAVISLCDLLLSYPTTSVTWKGTYVVCLAISGAVVAGAGSWALTRALAATGALAPLASGRTAARV
jgi:energy-coupling factor transport system substrate-specific component